LRRGDHDDLLRVPRAEAGRSVPHAHRRRVARMSPPQIQARIAQLTAALERCRQALAEGASNTGMKRGKEA
jgi:hypothetical protein